MPRIWLFPVLFWLCAVGLWLTPLDQLPAAAQSPNTGTLPPPPELVRLPLIVADPASASICPLTSTNNYQTTSILGAPRNGDRAPSDDPDLNLTVRSYKQTTASLNLVSINGPTDSDAPQLAYLFRPERVPALSGAHQVHEWNWGCCPGGVRGNVISEPEVTLVEMATTPGERLYPPQRNANIHGDFVAMVLYAERFRITFTYTRDDSPAQGYVVHVENFCVDPKLLTLYEQMHAQGRGQLPALRRTDSIGTALSRHVMVAIRDTGSFMDPRSGKDWWQATVRALMAMENADAAEQPEPTAP